MIRRVAVGAVIGLALVGLGGCSVSVGGGSSITTDDVEQQLVTLQKEASPSLQVGKAVCPDKVAADTGTTFECLLTVEGVEVPYEVKVTGLDEEEERGQFDIRPTRAVLDTAKVVEFLTGQLNQGARGAQVDCGAAKVKVVDEGATFECTIRNAGRTETVTLRADDLDGTVSVVGSR